MKTKLFNLLAAALLVFGVLMPAFAVMAQEKQGETTDSITVHKILMKENNFNSQNFPGTQGLNDENYIGKKINEISGYFGQGSQDIGKVYFAWQKKEGEDWKYIDKFGKILANQPKEEKPDDASWVEVLGKETKEGEGAIFSNLSSFKGEYRVVEVKTKSNYVGKNDEVLTKSKAVPVNITLPLVNNNGIVKEGHIYPKNTENKPKIDKSLQKTHNLPIISGNNANSGADYLNYGLDKVLANAEIGKEVKYEVKTEIPEGSEYKTISWEDIMSQGLTYQKNLTILMNNSVFEQKYYEKEENKSGFTLKLNNSGLDYVKEQSTKTKVEFHLMYSAVVNKDAVVELSDTNQVKFDYSNKPKTKVIPPKPVKPQNNNIEITKNWSESPAPSNITVVYYLYEKGATADSDKVVDKVTKDGTSDYNHTFKNLSSDKQYYVKEIVSGYTPEYISIEDGKVTIKNTKDSNNPKSLIPTSPKVVTYGKKFVKTNQNGKERLSGAEFYIVNQQNNYLVAKTKDKSVMESEAVKQAKKELEEAIVDYNSLDDKKQQGQPGVQAKKVIDTKQENYNKIFKEESVKYEWTSDKDKALILVSDSQGRFEITGLEKGQYNLIEKTAPLGYARQEKPITFMVDETSYSNTTEDGIDYNIADKDKKDAQKVINLKVVIPQTGGIGTVIFTVAGLAIMAGAGYVMIRRRNHDQA